MFFTQRKKVARVGSYYLKMLREPRGQINGRIAKASRFKIPTQVIQEQLKQMKGIVSIAP